jgi:magnesium transporter
MKTVDRFWQTEVSRFECHDGADLISLYVPKDADQLECPEHVFLYHKGNLLLFAQDGDNDAVAATREELQKGEVTPATFGRILFTFFDRLTYDDTPVIEQLEKETSAIEEELVSAYDVDTQQDIMCLRKKTLVLKQYYEQLVEIVEAIVRSENSLFEPHELRLFTMLEARVDRLCRSVLNLREYGSQLREAYQAQIDISLNRVMKVFTVVTSIFLPLTLLVGWYGMNLNMPEYRWEHGYLFVGGFAVVLLAVTIYFLKKRKWF